MTQTRSAIIVAIKPSMEYATLCISIRWATPAIRQWRASSAAESAGDAVLGQVPDAM
jgi:hypothetical protein